MHRSLRARHSKKFAVQSLMAGAVLTGIGWMVSVISAANAEPHEAQSPDKPLQAMHAGLTNETLIAVAPPPWSDPDIFPCSDCHDPADWQDVNTTPHEVEDHPEVVFEHDSENRWCLDCHDLKNRDKLHLANGTLLDFSESYKLCGQCHGPKLRDWKAGEHGKRTGSWSGNKDYLLCASCHNPHSPSIKPITPEPAPVPPNQLRVNP